MQKAKMTSVLVVVFLLIQVIEVVQSVTCYNCNSVDYTNCGESFTSSSGIPTCTGVTCSKAVATYSGVTAFVRSCYSPYVQTACADVSVQGVTGRGCFCNSDLCNSGDRLPQNHSLILILAIIALYSIFRK